MSLLSLPNEVLSSLPFYIDDIKTFINAASSCRRMRENFESFAEAYPKAILLLVDASASTFFSPHPLYLIAATARQVSRWALGNKEHTDQLRKLFREGINSLYEFCLNNPNIGLTMEDLRRLHRFSIINPLADQIVGMAGAEWHKYHSASASLEGELDVAAFQIVIYGELFGSSMQAFLESEEKLLPSFDVETRLDYFKYCIHDVERPRVNRQLALLHILHCNRWRQMWAQVKSMIDRNFGEAEQDEDGEGGKDVCRYIDEPWSQKLYRNALLTQGLEGMQLVILPKEGISKECRDQALQIKQRVELLQEEFDDETRRNEPESRLKDAPDPAGEISKCMARFCEGCMTWLEMPPWAIRDVDGNDDDDDDDDDDDGDDDGDDGDDDGDDDDGDDGDDGNDAI
jgi:hypothetical protein